MTEHLPECPYCAPCPDEWRNARTIKAEGLPVPHRIVSGSSGRCVECGAGDCICDELSACEARVHEAAYQAGKAYGLTVNGYTRGLDAAREAVAALGSERELRSPSGLDIDIHDALAAIDALRDPVA